MCSVSVILEQVKDGDRKCAQAWSGDSADCFQPLLFLLGQGEGTHGREERGALSDVFVPE